MKALQAIFLVLALGSSSALACGGEDLTDENILGSQELIAVSSKIQETYGQDVVVSEILRTGNKILNIDKVEVLSAMCAANYHHVYLLSKNSDKLRCLVVFEPGYPGQIKNESNEIRVSCSLSGGKQTLVRVPFKKSF